MIGNKEKIEEQKYTDFFIAAVCIVLMRRVSPYFSLRECTIQNRKNWEKSVL